LSYSPKNDYDFIVSNWTMKANCNSLYRKEAYD